MAAVALAAHAGEFSVSPIRAELKPGALSETITVTNHAQQRLRVSIKLMAWSQDEQGKDIYTESADLVYFPRQMDIEADAKKVVRVGLKSPLGEVERTYRLFIEEIRDQFASSDQPAVNFNFRFGVPIFVPPSTPRTAFEVMDLVLQQGKLVIPVSNTGNQHVRPAKVTVGNGDGYSQDLTGWYSLANTRREYRVDIPQEVCRKSRTLLVVVEGPDLRLDRQLHVDPASCA